MRILATALLVTLIPFPGLAQQTVLSFSQAEEQHVSIENIDKRYEDAIHANPEQALFSSNQSEFIQEYKIFIQKLARHLNENDFFWDEPTRIFNRIYFSKDGHVDYFFYNEEDAGFNDNKIKKFNTIITDFIANHSLNMQSESAYAQCSPVIYNNVLEKD